MSKLNLDELTKKHFNTAAKIKKIPRYKDDYIIDLIGIFKYIDKVTKNNTPGGVIKDFVIQQDIVNSQQQEVLKKLSEQYYQYYSYLLELQGIGNEDNFSKAIKFKREKSDGSTAQIIGFSILGIAILALIIFITKFNNMETYNNPACEALGMQSNWNDTECRFE